MTRPLTLAEIASVVNQAADALHEYCQTMAAYGPGRRPGALVDAKEDLRRIADELTTVAEVKP